MQHPAGTYLQGRYSFFSTIYWAYQLSELLQHLFWQQSVDDVAKPCLARPPSQPK